MLIIFFLIPTVLPCKRKFDALSEKLEYLFFSLGHFHAISWTLCNKYFRKIFSALCVDVFPIIISNFSELWHSVIYDERFHLKNCLLIHTCSTSISLFSMVGQVSRVIAFYTRGQWIKSLWMRPYFLYRNKTSEYSEIYLEQLSSEHFLPNNYSTGHVHNQVYLRISADFYGSANVQSLPNKLEVIHLQTEVPI